MDRKYVGIAVMLARMYGVGETLNEWEFLSNDKFLRMIGEWTEEFIGLVNGDIVEFFESKVGR